MTETAVVKAKSLEERVTEKLHEQIGELLTTEDLRDMVSRGVEEALFKPRYEPARSSWDRPNQKPPLIEEVVSKHLELRMRQAVEEWINENPAKIEEVLKRIMQAGVADALVRTLDYRFGGLFDQAIQSLKANGTIPA